MNYDDKDAWLLYHGVCSPAHDWSRDKRTLADCWEQLEEPHWLIWMLKAADYPNRMVLLMELGRRVREKGITCNQGRCDELRKLVGANPFEASRKEKQ